MRSKDWQARTESTRLKPQKIGICSISNTSYWIGDSSQAKDAFWNLQHKKRAPEGISGARTILGYSRLRQCSAHIPAAQAAMLGVDQLERSIGARLQSGHNPAEISHIADWLTVDGNDHHSRGTEADLVGKRARLDALNDHAVQPGRSA